MKSTVDNSRSFAYFVYPFLFDLHQRGEDNGDAFRLFAEHVGQAMIEGKTLWQEWPLPKDDLMPHLAGFLDSTVHNDIPTGRFWKLQNDLAQKLQSDKIAWMLRRGRRKSGIPFTFGGEFSLHLALFRNGVGLIAVSARPISDDLEDWMSFLHDFRFMGRRDGVDVCATRETYDPATRQKARASYLPFGLIASEPESPCRLMDILAAVLEPSGILARPVFTPGHTLPYAALFIQGIGDAEQGLTLYKIRNFFSADQAVHPAAADVSPLHPSQYAYAHNQFFVQTLDGGSFVAFESPDEPLDEFNRAVLPGHLKGVYFCATLLALYQRFALASFSQRVASMAAQNSPAAPDDRIENWESIHYAFLDFSARGFFNQAMQSDHHQRYYRTWQETLRIPQLYDEVRDEIRDLYEQATMRLRRQEEEREQAEEKREARFQKVLTMLGALFVLPSLMLSFLSVNLRGVTSESEGMPILLVALLVGTSIAIGGLLTWLLTANCRCANTTHRTKDPARKNKGQA